MSSCSGDEDCSDQKLNMKDIWAAVTAPVISFRGLYVRHRWDITFHLTSQVRARRLCCSLHRHRLVFSVTVCVTIFLSAVTFVAITLKPLWSCFYGHTTSFKLPFIFPNFPPHLPSWCATSPHSHTHHFISFLKSKMWAVIQWFWFTNVYH